MPNKSNKPKTLTAPQRALALDLEAIYRIKPAQIFFEGDGLENVYLDHAATLILANELGDFTDITVLPDKAKELREDERGAVCTITTSRGFKRTSFGVARIGGEMPYGTIADEDDALDVAKARALRAALLMVNFDPIAAHLAAMEGHSVLAAPRTDSDQRNADIAQIHVLAEQLGWAKSANEEHYRDMLHLFTGKTSSAHLTERERGDLIREWRDLVTKSASERALYVTALRSSRWRRQSEERGAAAA